LPWETSAAEVEDVGTESEKSKFTTKNKCRLPAIHAAIYFEYQRSLKSL